MDQSFKCYMCGVVRTQLPLGYVQDYMIARLEGKVEPRERSEILAKDERADVWFAKLHNHLGCWDDSKAVLLYFREFRVRPEWIKHMITAPRYYWHVLINLDCVTVFSEIVVDSVKRPVSNVVSGSVLRRLVDRWTPVLGEAFDGPNLQKCVRRKLRSCKRAAHDELCSLVILVPARELCGIVADYLW